MKKYIHNMFVLYANEDFFCLLTSLCESFSTMERLFTTIKYKKCLIEKFTKEFFYKKFGEYKLSNAIKR